MTNKTKKTTDHIYALRSEYESKRLEKATASRNPFEQFEIWMAEAIAAEVDEPNAMVLSTATKDGKPSARVVLLRGFDRKGFVFYTNYDSQKSDEIAENPHASLVFFWSKLQRQVRIEGEITRASRRLSQTYFATRPRMSQIAAWASAQSRAIPNRLELEKQIAEMEKRFEGREVPCPEFWGGFVLKPDLFEFWQGGKSRLHDRLRYIKTKQAWKIERLCP
jgi:pyridoxamine 5'-phosphate oxidase